MSHAGQMISLYCKCGHLKDKHQPMPDGSIECQEMIFGVFKHKCTCVIHKVEESSAWI